MPVVEDKNSSSVVSRESTDEKLAVITTREGSNISKIQEDVQVVVAVMKSNVEKVMVRDEQLTELEIRANELSQSASNFELQSKELKKNYWSEVKGGLFFLIPVLLFFITFACKSFCSYEFYPNSCVVRLDVSNK